MEVEQDHMVMSGRYGEQEGDGCKGTTLGLGLVT